METMKTKTGRLADFTLLAGIIGVLVLPFVVVLTEETGPGMKLYAGAVALGIFYMTSLILFRSVRSVWKKHRTRKQVWRDLQGL